jgi:hypothetical protein
VTADELRAYMAEHHDSLTAVAATAPPPPPEAIAILRATNCPIVRSAPTARRRVPAGSATGRDLPSRAAS